MEAPKKRANYRKRGTYYEQVSINWLKGMGYDIIENNYRCKFGEIDLIAKDGDTIVFIEVKFRSNCKMGQPWEAVGTTKQHRISQCAKWYMLSKKLPDTTQVRFDVISICGSEITHYKHAFNTR